MNEIAKTNARTPATAAQIKAGGDLAAIVPQDIDQALRLSRALAMAGDMVPRDFQNQPEKIMGAILRGQEVGLAPMQALSNIAVINGRATLWGDALPALMQKAGHHVDVEIEGDGDNARAVATLTRGDTGKSIVRTFSMADAKRAGLASKKGPWQDYPTRMLMHRARSWAIRDGAADALMGMQVAEEVSDYQGPDNARDVTPRKPRGGGVTLAAPDPDPEPTQDGEAPAAVDQILEGEAYGPDLPDELVSAYDRIMDDLSEAESALSVAKTVDTFKEEIEAIRAASPDHGAEIDAAAESARAA